MLFLKLNKNEKRYVGATLKTTECIGVPLNDVVICFKSYPSIKGTF